MSRPSFLVFDYNADSDKIKKSRLNRTKRRKIRFNETQVLDAV